MSAGPFDSQVFLGSVDGSEVRFTQWSTVQGAYGSGGSLNISFPLTRNGLIPFTKAGQAPADIIELAEKGNGLVEIAVFAPARTKKPRVSIPQQPTLVSGTEYVPTAALTPNVEVIPHSDFLPVTYQPARVFGGYLDISTLHLRNSLLSVEARDWASLLMEGKITDERFTNKTVRDVVEQFARDTGLNTTDTPSFIQGATDQVGTYLQRDRVMPVTLTTRWDLLQLLARDLGYVCFVTPNKGLYFAPPNVNNDPPIEYNWGTDMEDLQIRHRPRRNRSFHVIVNSYHPKQTKTPRATFTQRGGGRAAAALPTYTFYFEGLTQEQCASLAEAKAQEIARREIVLTGTVAGDAGLTPWGGGVVVNRANKALDGQVFHLNSVSHSYDIPQDGGDHGGGYVTTWHALNIPPSSAQDGVPGGL